MSRDQKVLTKDQLEAKRESILVKVKELFGGQFENVIKAFDGDANSPDPVLLLQIYRTLKGPAAAGELVGVDQNTIRSSISALIQSNQGCAHFPMKFILLARIDEAKTSHPDSLILNEVEQLIKNDDYARFNHYRDFIRAEEGGLVCLASILENQQIIGGDWRTCCYTVNADAEKS